MNMVVEPHNCDRYIEADSGGRHCTFCGEFFGYSDSDENLNKCSECGSDLILLDGKVVCTDIECFKAFEDQSQEEEEGYQ